MWTIVFQNCMSPEEGCVSELTQSRVRAINIFQPDLSQLCVLNAQARKTLKRQKNPKKRLWIRDPQGWAEVNEMPWLWKGTKVWDWSEKTGRKMLSITEATLCQHERFMKSRSQLSGLDKYWSPGKKYLLRLEQNLLKIIGSWFAFYILVFFICNLMFPILLLVSVLDLYFSFVK